MIASSLPEGTCYSHSVYSGLGSLICRQTTDSCGTCPVPGSAVISLTMQLAILDQYCQQGYLEACISLITSDFGSSSEEPSEYLVDLDQTVIYSCP